MMRYATEPATAMEKDGIYMNGLFGFSKPVRIPLVDAAFGWPAESPEGLLISGAGDDIGFGLIPCAAEGGSDTFGAPVTAPLDFGIPSCTGLWLGAPGPIALTGGNDGELVEAGLGEDVEEDDTPPCAQTEEPMVKTSNNVVFQEPAIVDNAMTSMLGNCQNCQSSIEVQ
jgi:hypothetical protein